MILLAGCAGTLDGSAAASARLYKYAGSVQCMAGGLTLADMERELAGAGVRVMSSTCGHDGRMYAAVCGGGDGRIGIVTVSQADVSAAAKLGYAALSTLSHAAPAACR